MVVYIVGASRSGKTTVTEHVVNQSSEICGRSLDRIDLDEKLGPSDRGRAQKAIEVCEQITTRHRSASLLIVDVGAGQLVEREFREFLKSSGAYPDRVIVVDCGEQAFRERHGANAVNEVERYYGPQAHCLAPGTKRVVVACVLILLKGAPSTNRRIISEGFLERLFKPPHN